MGTTQQPPSVHLRGVHVAFRDGLALHIKDFQVAGGAQILVTGPSGHGKTTLLHLIAGLLIPRCGAVEVGGTNLVTLPESARCYLRRQQFGLVFQTLNLLGHLTACENVQLGLWDRSEAQAQAMAALTQLQMAPFAAKPVATLSLGQQQRVAVARVLAAKPRLILADEPTSSLDSANADAVLKALFSAAADATLVMVSHDLRVHPAFPRVYSTDAVFSTDEVLPA